VIILQDWKIEAIKLIQNAKNKYNIGDLVCYSYFNGLKSGIIKSVRLEITSELRITYIITPDGSTELSEPDWVLEDKVMPKSTALLDQFKQLKDR